MRKLLLIFTIIFNINAIVLSSFHNHFHYSKFENCLVLNYQNNSPNFNSFEIKFEKPLKIFEILLSFKNEEFKSTYITELKIRSPPIIS